VVSISNPKGRGGAAGFRWSLLYRCLGLACSLLSFLSWMCDIRTPLKRPWLVVDLRSHWGSILNRKIHRRLARFAINLNGLELPSEIARRKATTSKGSPTSHLGKSPEVVEVNRKQRKVWFEMDHGSKWKPPPVVGQIRSKLNIKSRHFRWVLWLKARP